MGEGKEHPVHTGAASKQATRLRQTVGKVSDKKVNIQAVMLAGEKINSQEGCKSVRQADRKEGKLAVFRAGNLLARLVQVA